MQWICTIRKASEGEFPDFFDRHEEDMAALRSERDSNSQFPTTLAFGVALNTEQAENAQDKRRQSRCCKDRPCNP